MKATDLMIGDWVLMDMNFSEENPIYTQPDYRHYQIKNGEDINLACETNCLGDADVYLPIPLTPEILEKNGFESQHNVGYVLEHYDDYTIIVDLWNHTLKILMNYKVVFEKEYFDTIPLQELQHALKLCGIKNSFEL